MHTPFGPVHCVSSLHWTHVLSGTSQTGVPALHAETFVAEHCVHVPAFAPAVTHAGAAAVEQAAVAPEPRSPLHPMQVPAALQVGVAPEHSALEPHCTQEWLVSLQTGVAPVQSTLSVLVHCTHVPAPAPAVTQAGAVVDEHACGVPELRSPSHATQTPAEQIGVVPEHAASVRHATHVFVVVLQVGVAPPH